MSTLAALLPLLGETGIKPWYEGQQGVNREQIGRQQAQTGLIELARLKQSQASEEEVMAYYRQHPELLVGGGSTLGSPALLQPPPGAAAPGAITQSPLGGGPAPQIPTAPDLSRYANVPPSGGGPIPPGVMGQVMPTVTPPPQSTIASLTPQPQGGMQGPQNPLLAMARKDPRAAMMLQQQLQARQAQDWKLQEQRLDMGVKVSEAVARQLQGVTDQASLDEARERIRLIHPQAAAQVPQMYSKEAVESIQQRGIAVADMAAWKLNMARAREANVKAEMLPKLLEQEGVGGTTPAPGGTPATPPAGPGRAPQDSDTTRAIRAEAVRQGVDPDLAVAVATQESSLSPNATGDGGKALGYFQLHEGAAKDAGIDPAQRGDPALNIRGGVTYLKQKLAQSKGNVDEALTRYNGDGDPNYVANVRRFLPGGARSSTGGAPPEDPRVPGLRAQIKQGQAKAKQYALLGYESMATQYSKDVDDLQKEVDRLEAPRRAYETKLATAGLEKDIAGEQGRQAAQIKADTEPASKEEIDAVNRSLPPDKRVPYGTTRKQLREQGRVGGEPLSPKLTDDLTNTTTAIQQFEELSTAVGTLPTGPLTQYVEAFKERWGIDISDEKVAYRAILAGAGNQLLTARSGTAINESEYRRLMNELPNESNDPKVFKARLANTLRQFKNIYKTKVQILRKLGHAIPDALLEPLAAPEGPPAPKTSTAVDRARDAMKPR